MKILGMGWPELVIILIVILLIFGPKNLPKLGSALGKTVSNLRSGMNEGKKKNDEASAEDEKNPSTDNAGSSVKPAELEGEVEEVLEEDEGSKPSSSGDLEDAEKDSKKVKRVVRKKVTND